MDNIIISTEGIGIFRFLALLAAGGAIGAYTLLHRGFLAAAIAISLVAFGWVYFLPGKPQVPTFIAWAIIEWTCTLALIGLIRVTGLWRAGRLGLLGTDIGSEG